MNGVYFLEVPVCQTSKAMKQPKCSMSFFHFAVRVLMTMSIGSLFGQPTVTPSADTAPEPLNWTTQQDHRNMMEQLGIKALRPGPNGRAGATNEANYNPAKANPYPDLPDPLTLKNGRKVTTAEMWWKQRRPEIVKDVEREVVGRVPQNVPKVTWAVVTQATDRVVGEIPVV